jgi:glucose/arabinose dehydrogenase
MIIKFALPLAFIATIVSSYGKLGVEKVASGFDRPVWAGMPRGSKQKLWVMEQAGQVWIVDLNTGERGQTPFLDIRKDVSRKGNEEGLLGLAFAPDFLKSGRYYVNFTDTEHHTRIVRYTTADQTTTDPAAGETLIDFKQPYENHNGGWICFGPDGMLYIGNGDGGAANDPQQHGQALDTLLGKILRIDVSGDTGYTVPPDNPFLGKDEAKPEIWAYGVRNPWRCSFDRITGDFWMGDVGQNTWEEIDFMPAGKGAGANYGWRLREGAVPTPANGVGGDAPTGAIEPVYVYQHGGGNTEGFSVTGGYLYRGPVKELQGRYVFADFQNPRIWSFRMKDGKAEDFTDHTADLQPEGGKIEHISSFAESNSGELFIVDHSGPVYRVLQK